ncbi:molybdate ABC transporter substrate-binding protein [Yersinia alsatica]|uniref:molybdate ABC transporter substrate-binding protein n=1 Tax=Yersinia alsatica TaxID=2890317 RepID=UPI0022A8C7A9
MLFNRMRLAVLATLLTVAASASYADPLHLYAGAGLRLPVEDIITQFEANTGHKVTVEYGGSGQILTRYQLTNEGDLFLPGSADYVEKLSKEGKITASYPLVRHTAVMAVRRDKAGDIKDLADLANSPLRLGMGDAKAIALGASGEKMLEMSGHGEQLRAKVIVRAATIKQLLMYLLNGDVDAAVIGRSDAVKNAQTLVILPTPAGVPEDEVTIATLKTSHSPAAAQQLADYFASEKGIATFTAHGFLPLVKQDKAL